MAKKYAKVEAKECLGKNALTVEKMKDLMGWTTDKKEAKAAKITEPFVTLKNGNEETQVWCLNNTKNRPFSESWARQLSQDILNRNWADSRNGEDMTVNGETIVVDYNGEIQSGQHRLMAGIFAELERTEGPYAKHWQESWPDEITMEAIVVYGVSPNPRVIRTLDNVKPRSFSDVLFTDQKFCPKAKSKAEREKIAKFVDFAVRMMWLRTGCSKDPFAPKRTHSEGLDFLERHSKIKDAVMHIDSENIKLNKSKNAIARYINPGFAAALLYLMGTSKSDFDKYYNNDNPKEKLLNFDLWSKACEFWTKVATNDPALKPMFEEFANLADMNTVGDGTTAEKMAILIKAWNLFSSGKKLRRDMLEVEYKEKEDGSRRLDDYPKVGGIDKGDTSVQKSEEADDEAPTPEEIKEMTKKNREEKPEGKKDKKKDKKGSHKGMIRLDDDEDEDEEFEDDEDDVADEDEEDEVESDDDEGFDDEEDESDDEDEEDEEDEDDEPVTRRTFKKNGKSGKKASRFIRK